MSKKTLKRSLALGALMAFVIAGSAMAAETDYALWSKENTKTGYESTHNPDKDLSYFKDTAYKGDYYSKPVETNGVNGWLIQITVVHADEFNSWDDFKGKLFDVEEGYYPDYKKLEDDVTLNSGVGFVGDNASSSNASYNNTDLNGHKLTINNDGAGYALESSGFYNNFGSVVYHENYGDPQGPTCQYKHIYSGLENLQLDLPGFNIYNGDLEINSSTAAVLGYGKIDVDDLKITSDSNAIQSQLEGFGSVKPKEEHKMEIYANSMEVNTKGNAIQVYNDLDIGSADKPVGQLDIQGKDGGTYERAIRVAYSTVDGYPIGVEKPVANIYANVLNISDATESSKISNNGTLNLNANSGEITNEFYAASTGTINATLGAGVEWTGKFVTDDDATKGKLDLSGKWTLKDVAADTIEKGKVNSLTEATFQKGSEFVIDGKAYVNNNGENEVYALNGVGGSSLIVKDGAKLTVTDIDKNIYNIATGFKTLEGTKVDENTNKYWDITNLNTLMQGNWLEDINNGTLKLEVIAKDASALEDEMGVSESTAQSIANVTTAAQAANVTGNPEGTGEVKAVALVEAMAEATPEVAGQAYEAVSKMAEAGGNSATAASIVKNVTGVTNDRLSFNCGHSAPHKGGHGVGLFEEGSGADVWVEYVHGKDEVEDMPSTAGASSYEGQYNGIVMGVDFKKVNKFQSGIAFNYGEGDTNSVGSSARTHSDYDFWGIGYYGSIHNDDSNVIFDIGYAQTDSDVETKALGITYNASPETTTWTAGVKLEKLYQNENVQIVPYTGLRFMSIDPEDYSTECASSKYDMERQNVWLLPLGVSIRQEVANDNGWTVSPRVDLSYIWAFGDTDSEMEFSTLGTKTNIGYEVMDDGSFLGLVGIEAHKGQWGFGVSYSYQKGDYSTSKKWFVDANYSF